MASKRDDDRSQSGVSPYSAMFLGAAAAKRLAQDGETRPQKAMSMAEKMRRSGADERAIYAATNKILEGSPYAGVSYDAAGKPRFELSDHDAKLKRFGLPASREGFVGDILDHPNLDRATGAGMNHVRHVNRDVRGGYGDGIVFLGNKQFGKDLAGRANLGADTKGVLLHEIQHFDQDVTGRPQGGAPSDFEKHFPGPEHEGTRRALYRSIAGENEAELTRMSADMTPEQRRAEHPDDRAKRFGQLPRDQQIVMDQHGRIQESSQPPSIRQTPRGQTAPEAAAKWGKILDSLPVDQAEQKRIAKAKGASVNKQGSPVRMSLMADSKPRAAKIGDNVPADLKAMWKTADKLQAVAERTIAEAQRVHDAPRLMNTARRARMGSGIMAEQQQRIADAKTALKIAAALRQGEAGALSKVKSLADIRALRQMARDAEYATDRKLNRSYKEGGHGLTRADVANLGSAQGYVRVSPRDVEEMKAALAGKKGLGDAFRTLERYASNTNGPHGQTSYATSDSRVFEAMRTVANAVKKADDLKTQYPHQAKMLKYSANKYLDAIREFDRSAGVAGTDAASRQAALHAFLDVRENKVGPNAAAVAERNLIGMKIPGFFPTPESLAKRMADIADIKAGQTVLEPSAGSGRLADVAKARGAKVDAVEMSSTLRDILQKKGHNLVDSDFTSMKAEPKYDRILMNPPFEKGQDMAHVQRAYEMLKPGGKMVAVMGEGAFFRGDKQAEGFRSWLDQVRGTSEKLPEGTFKESNTGVNTRLVTIEKPAAIAEAAVKAATTGHNGPASIQEAVDAHAKAYDAHQAALRQQWGGETGKPRPDLEGLKAERDAAYGQMQEALRSGKPAGWSDAARTASADERGVARPGEAKPDLGHNAPKHTAPSLGGSVDDVLANWEKAQKPGVFYNAKVVAGGEYAMVNGQLHKLSMGGMGTRPATPAEVADFRDAMQKGAVQIETAKKWGGNGSADHAPREVLHQATGRDLAGKSAPVQSALERAMARSAERAQAAPKEPTLVVPARPGAESYGENKVRAQARANILNKDGSGYVVERTSAGWTVQHDGSAPKAAGEYPVIPQGPLHEIRNRGDSKRHFVYADGQPIKDSKGQDKWFGTREKAQAFIEKRKAGLEKFANGGKVGFQNESTLNAALNAQGKADKGGAKPKKSRAATTKAKLKEAAGPQPTMQERIAPMLAEQKPAQSAHSGMKTAASKLGKGVNSLGTVAMIAAPVAAAAVAFDATRNQAKAAGADDKAATAKGALAATAAGGTAAAIGYGVAKAMQGGFALAAKAAPKIAPALGPVGVAIGVGFMAKGAYEGYKAHGVKGAILGTVGAEGLLDLGKQAPGKEWSAPAAAPADKAKAFEGKNAAFDGSAAPGGGMTREAAHQFATANEAHQRMQAATQEAQTGPIEVNEFSRTRRTKSGKMVTENVKAYQRQRIA